MLWDYSIQTDKKIRSNNSDITIKDNREKNCKLIDLKISAAKKVSVAEFGNLSKYKSLETELEKLSHMKTVTLPVAIETLE